MTLLTRRGAVAMQLSCVLPVSVLRGGLPPRGRRLEDRSPMQTSSSRSPSTVKFSPNWPKPNTEGKSWLRNAYGFSHFYWQC